MEEKTRNRTNTGIIILILILVCFGPRSIVQDLNNCEIISIMYRADEWEQLRNFYPYLVEKQPINEEALLRLLRRSKAVPTELIPSTTLRPFPSGGVTLLISISEGGKIKQILLGELDRVKVQENSVELEYYILNADSVLCEALELLKIDENTDLSIPDW